jgi:hypothetical protein
MSVLNTRQWAARSHYGPRDVASSLVASDFGGPVFDGSGGDAAVAVPAGVVARRLRYRDATLPAGASILLSMMIVK